MRMDVSVCPDCQLQQFTANRMSDWDRCYLHAEPPAAIYKRAPEDPFSRPGAGCLVPGGGGAPGMASFPAKNFTFLERSKNVASMFAERFLWTFLERTFVDYDVRSLNVRQ